MGLEGRFERPIHWSVQLTELEQRVAREIESRAHDLLEDLRLHVSIPTGGNNQQAIEETRERFGIRLQELGAKTHMVPGDAKPEWLQGDQHDYYTPPTVVSERLCGATQNRVLIAGPGHRARPGGRLPGSLDCAGWQDRSRPWVR